ncbi:MAG: hypothetical protein LBF56_01865 [Holosporales bacterium]|nr:hypothetical protein [Holosporales bacterium]
MQHRVKLGEDYKRHIKVNSVYTMLEALLNFRVILSLCSRLVNIIFVLFNMFITYETDHYQI